MALPMDSRTIMLLNERRQQAVLAELADEHQALAVGQGGGVVAFKEGVDWLSGAIGCGLDRSITDAGVDRIANFLRSRGATPSIDLTDLVGEEAFNVLSRAGLALKQVERVFARDLGALEEPEAAPGVRIEPLDVDDDDAVRALVRHRVEGFTKPGEAPSDGDFEAAESSQRHPRSRGFIAYADGELAGTCGMEIMELAPAQGEPPVRLASLWGAVVSEPFRRRGIQAALIARRLRQGIEEGCSVAVIECEPGIPTERNAIRLGFSLAYTRLGFKAPVSA
ncbi:MAG: GNAT family N-acetyltransferase [Planctomycetota bacterium]